MLFFILLTIVTIATILVTDRNYAYMRSTNVKSVGESLLCGTVMFITGTVMYLGCKALMGVVTNDCQLAIILMLVATLPASVIYCVAKK